MKAAVETHVQQTNNMISNDTTNQVTPNIHIIITCLLWVRHPFTVKMFHMVKDFPHLTKNIKRNFLQGNQGRHSMHCTTYTVQYNLVLVMLNQMDSTYYVLSTIELVSSS